MADENKDIAVLGFQIRTEEATNKLRGITAGLSAIDKKMDETDRRLEQKVTHAMQALQQADNVVGSIASNEQKVSNVIAGISQLVDLVKGMDKVGAAATAMNTALTTLDTDRVAKLTKEYVKMAQTFEGGVMTLKVAVDVTNPDAVQRVIPPKVSILFDPVEYETFTSFMKTVQGEKLIYLKTGIQSTSIASIRETVEKEFENKPLKVPITFTVGGQNILSSEGATATPVTEAIENTAKDIAKAAEKQAAVNPLMDSILAERDNFMKAIQDRLEDNQGMKAWAEKNGQLDEVFSKAYGQDKKALEVFKGVLAELKFRQNDIDDWFERTDISGAYANLFGGASAEPPKVEMPVPKPSEVNNAVRLSENAMKAIQDKISLKATIDTSEFDENIKNLSTSLETVTNAYQPFAQTLDHIKETLTQINTLMSEEVKMVIRGAEKKGAADADAIVKKTERELANDAKIARLKADSEHALNTARRKAAEEEWELRKDLQENYNGGLKYDETIALQRDLTAAYTEGEQKIQDARTRGAFVMNFAKDRADNLTQSVRENVAQTMEQAKSLARATADASRHSKALRDVSLAMQDYGRVQKVNMIDPLARLKAELGDTNSRLVDLGRTFGIYMSGRTIVNYFRQAAESANNFAMEIRRIQSLATDFDFSTLREGLLDIDARFGNVLHNAQALYWAYSSGVRGSEDDLVKFTEHMSKLSTTIKSDIMPTIDAATSIMNAFNLSASSAAEIGDTLFGIVKFGKSNAQQLTTSLGHVVAPAAALNVSLDELGATAATLTRTMKTNRAFTYLSNILGKMASPTKAVQEAAAELGIELSANAIKAKGFANVMREIRQATGGDIGKIAKLFPDLRGQRAAITLLSTQFGDFEQQLENFKHKHGSMEEALGKISDTPEAQIRALKNSLSMIALEVGNVTNNVLTLGGALGPVLEKFNAMGHVGRAITGNLVASVGAWGGYLVAAKAAQAAQYAILQATYQQASASMDIRRNELDIALTKERQALENNKIALSEMKAQIAADQYNDETLRTLRAQEDTLKKVIGDRKQEIVIMKQALNLQDKAMNPRLANMAALVGERSGTVHGLKSILADLQGDDRALRTTTTANLIGRMQATISQSMAKIQGENQTMANIMGREFQHLVETAPELQEALRSAIQKGSFEGFESAKEELQTIVGIIKNSTVIQSQLSQNDRGEDLLDLMVQQNILAGMKKQLVSGEAFQHEWVVKLVKQELNIAQSQLESERLKYDQTLKNVKAGTADLEQLEAIEKKVAERVAYETELRDIVNSIDEREGQLVGRRKEYAAILSENVKLMKAWLDADTTDSANIKANLDLALKNAAMLGKGTLNAVKAAYDAEMQHQSVLMDQRSVLTEIMSITDENGKLLSNDEKTQERYNKLLAQQKDLLEKAEASRQRFVELGLKAGNQDAMRMFLKDWNGRIDLGKIVDKTMMDRAVRRESIRAMSRDIGGRFGAVNGMMRTASIMGSFVPGMGKLAMPMGLLSSFNVVGKAAGGMANLTASMMNLLGTTDKLKKQGILALNANVASFTRTLMLSGAWTKKMALAEKELMAMRMKGMSANALAGASVKATWWTAGLGIAGILAGAITTWFVLNSTKKGGPLGELAESMIGIGKLERNSKAMDATMARLKENKQANDEMIRSMERIRKSFAGNQSNVDALKANLTNVQSMVSDQVVDSNWQILDYQRQYVVELSSSLNRVKNQKFLLEQAYPKIQNHIYSISQGAASTISEQIRQRLVDLYLQAAEQGVLPPKEGLQQDLWDVATQLASRQSWVNPHANEQFARHLADSLIIKPIETLYNMTMSSVVKRQSEVEHEQAQLDEQYIRLSSRVLESLKAAQVRDNPHLWEAFHIESDVMGLLLDPWNQRINEMKQELGNMRPMYGMLARLKQAVRQLGSQMFEPVDDSMDLFVHIQDLQKELLKPIEADFSQLQSTRSKLNSLRSDAKSLQQRIYAAIEAEKIMSDVYKSSEQSEKKLLGALDGIANSIQAEATFGLLVYDRQQKNMQRINEALTRLKKGDSVRSYQVRMQKFTKVLDEINQEIDQLTKTVEIASRTERPAVVNDYRRMLRDARERRANQQKLIDSLGEDGYDEWLKGVAEARFQILREQLGADQEAAFAPMKDTKGKLDLATKMTNMAWNRLSYVLGSGKELADLTGKTTEDVEEMVRKLNEDLSTPLQKVKDELDLAKEGLQRLSEGTDAYKEHEETVKKLQEDYDAKLKEYNEKMEAVRNALNDFYGKSVNEASLFVQNITEENKDRLARAKYFGLFQEGFGSIRVMEENIQNTKKGIADLEKMYADKTDVFANLDPEQALKRLEDSKRVLDKELMQSRTTYVELLKSAQESVASFMESVSNEAQNTQKSLFNFKLNNPMYAGMKDKLISGRMGMINSLLYGKDGKGGVIAMRNKAMEDARRLLEKGDIQEGMKAMQEAQKSQQKIVGYEQEGLDLVKMKADKEREINQSLYQLANTLRGQFAATSQAAVDVNSIEGIRLRSRRLGENIAPQNAVTAQAAEAKAWEQRAQESKKFNETLSQLATDYFGELTKKLGDADINGAAVKINTAADTFKTATDNLNTTLRGMQNVVIAVKRI